MSTISGYTGHRQFCLQCKIYLMARAVNIDKQISEHSLTIRNKGVKDVLYCYTPRRSDVRLSV